MKQSQDRVQLPREIWVLVAAAVCISLGYGIVAPVLPQFAKAFNVSTTAATVVVSAFAFSRLAFAPVSGRLTGKFGERKIYLAGILIVALSSAVSGLAQTYWQLLVLRGLGGIGSIMFTVSAMSLIIQLAPPHARGRASAAYGSGFLMGGIAGPALGAVIAPLGYRWPFFIYAVMLVIAVIIVAWMIPADGHERRKIRDAWHRASHTRKHPEIPVAVPKEAADEVEGVADSKADKKPDAVKQPPLTLADAFANPRFKLIIATAFVQGWANMGMRVAVVPLLTATIIVGPSWAPPGEWLAGGAMTAFAVGNVIALLRAGRWADLYGRRAIVILGLLLSGAFTITLGFTTTTIAVILVCVAGGFGSGFIQPAQQGAMADLVGKRQGGRVVSFFQQCGDLGQILGPIIAGLLIDFNGFTFAFVAAGVLLILAALLWILIPTPESEVVGEE